MTKKLISYEEELHHLLHDPNEAAAYLNAALEDEDPRVFLLAIRDVLKAQGGDMTSLAREANLNRENLYRMLSMQGNPKLTSICSVLHHIGFELTIRPSKK